MRAPQQTLNERIAASMYALLKPPPCDLNHRSAVAEPLFDYEAKALGFLSGDIRGTIITIARRVAEFNPVTAPKTERKKIRLVEAIIKRLRREVADLNDPSPYAAVLEAVTRPRAVSSAEVEKGPKRALRLRLAADLVLDLISQWGIGPLSLHEKGLFITLTCKIFEIATGDTTSAAAARRACALALDALEVPRLRQLNQILPRDELNRDLTEMARWVPLAPCEPGSLLTS
jgi:hypothetical protein